MKLNDSFKDVWEDTERGVSPELMPTVLVRLGLEQEGLFPSTSLQELFQALESEEWKTRVSVVRTLRSLKPSIEVNTMLTKAAQDKNKYVRMTAAHALAYHQKRRESETVSLAPADEDEEVYRQALRMQSMGYGIGNVDKIGLLFCMALLYTERHQHGKAEEFYRRALLASKQTSEPPSVSVHRILGHYAHLLREMRRNGEAARLEAMIDWERGPPEKFEG